MSEVPLWQPLATAPQGFKEAIPVGIPGDGYLFFQNGLDGSFSNSSVAATWKGDLSGIQFPFTGAFIDGK